ncbi:DUF368 domain-containing protein [Halopseudomonas xiamenensis]|uniref:DUF368 domain-containing protein n=1 Tax=Halopseudomonas xiamenensis TaxID=157792 RepID=UPI00162A8170|nr:DUF368 domain-containing protein [Halopseudomonas xiamenensis]
MAMGAADVVPGVSGGTIALIAGIYERLLAAISACTPDKLLWLLRGRVREAWRAIDGTFLVSLLAGVLTSIAAFANLIGYLLEAHPELIWSFFFGLILVSVYVVGREVRRWNIWTALLVLLGAVFAYMITVAGPLQWSAAPLMIFLAGAIAICAMVLPGISGSFVLVLLGLYATILGAVRSFDLALLAVFALGCVVGLLSFSRLVSWLLQHARSATMALATGLLIGSLNKVWPWKQTLSWRENSKGAMEPVQQSNLLPGSYETLTGEPSYWLGGLGLMLAAIILVLSLEWVGQRMRQR